MPTVTALGGQLEDLLGCGERLPGPGRSLDGQDRNRAARGRAGSLPRSLSPRHARNGPAGMPPRRLLPQQERGGRVLAVQAVAGDPVTEVAQALRLRPGVDRSPFDQRGRQRPGVVLADLQVDRPVLVVHAPTPSSPGR